MENNIIHRIWFSPRRRSATASDVPEGDLLVTENGVYMTAENGSYLEVEDNTELDD